MENTGSLNYSESISERILIIMNNSGLTIAGFSEITKISESHLYALINGNRDLTGSVADKLGKPFNLKGSQILRLDYKIPINFNRSLELINFKRVFVDNFEYFITTKNSSKASYYIEYELLNSEVFNQPVYLWEVILELEKFGKQYTSKELSQILHYLVTTGKLRSKKAPIKLKGGGYGTRMVEVYFNKHLIIDNDLP